MLLEHCRLDFLKLLTLTDDIDRFKLAKSTLKLFNLDSFDLEEELRNDSKTASDFFLMIFTCGIVYISHCHQNKLCHEIMADEFMKSLQHLISKTVKMEISAEALLVMLRYSVLIGLDEAIDLIYSKMSIKHIQHDSLGFFYIYNYSNLVRYVLGDLIPFLWPIERVTAFFAESTQLHRDNNYEVDDLNCICNISRYQSR